MKNMQVQVGLKINSYENMQVQVGLKINSYEKYASPSWTEDELYVFYIIFKLSKKYIYVNINT